MMQLASSVSLVHRPISASTVTSGLHDTIPQLTRIVNNPDPPMGAVTRTHQGICNSRKSRRVCLLSHQHLPLRRSIARYPSSGPMFPSEYQYVPLVLPPHMDQTFAYAVSGCPVRKITTAKSSLSLSSSASSPSSSPSASLAKR
jgi:hypothetical protein